MCCGCAASLGMVGSVFRESAAPADFQTELEERGCYVFPSVLTGEGCRRILAEIANTQQSQAWQAVREEGRQGRAARAANEPRTDTLGISEVGMLVRGPVEESTGVSLWPAPRTACFQLIDHPFVRGSGRHQSSSFILTVCTHCAAVADVKRVLHAGSRLLAPGLRLARRQRISLLPLRLRLSGCRA